MPIDDNGQRVDDAISSVTLQRRELSSLHTEADNHMNKALSLTGNWEKWMGADWSGSENPKTANATAQFVKYRTRFLWNTTEAETLANPARKLWGHNEDHEVKLLQPLAFEAANGVGQVTSVAVAAKTPSVHNLVITGVTTNAGNPDYIKFNPEAPAGDPFLKPTISFTIADDGDPHRYKWRVRARSTDVDNTWTDSILISGTATGPGTVTAKVNDPDATGQTQVSDMSSDPANDPTAYAPLAEWGTYTFDISIEEVDAADKVLDDAESYRSQKLLIPYLMPDGTGRGHGGDLVKDANGIESYSVHYYFHDISNPALPAGTQVSSMKIEMLPPNMGTPIAGSDNTWGKALEVGYYNKLLHTFAPQPRQPGIYITLFQAEDTHAAEYRDHQNKRTLTKNDRVGADGVKIEFTGLPRSCAGGVAADGVHDFSLPFNVKQDEEKLANAALEFSFENNQSFDPTKKARFRKPDNTWDETATIITDANGNGTLHVLSSDLISKNTKIVVKRDGQVVQDIKLNANAVQNGKVVCDFAAVESKRRKAITMFADNTYAADNGLKSTPEVLWQAGQTAQIKVFVKFRQDTSKPIDTLYVDPQGQPRVLNDATNWIGVNGHQLRIRLAAVGVKMKMGETVVASPAEFSQYVTLINDAEQEVTEINTPGKVTTHDVGEGTDGIFSFKVKAGPMIHKCLWFFFDIEDQTQRN